MSLEVGNWRVGVAVERYDGIDEFPHLQIGSMEDVCTILMDIDSLDGFTIYIAPEVLALVDDKTLLTCFFSSVCEGGSEEA